MSEQNQTNEPKTGTEEPKDVQMKEQTETKKEPTVDVERVKSDAVAEYLKSLGVEDSDTLKGIVTKAKEEEDKINRF